MKLGSTTGLFAAYGEHRYKKMKEMGFDYADYGINGELNGRTEEEYESLILAEKALADEAGVTIWQVHGPWRYPPHDETEERRAERAQVMRRSIRLTARIGCKNWVIHPVMPFGPDDDYDTELFRQINLDFFRALLPYAKEHGVTICFENMPMKKLSISTTEKTLEFIHMIDDDNFKLCLDTGHEAVFGRSVADAVRLAGKDLRVLHIHDNDGKGDRHWIPCTGVIDWKEFYKTIKEIGFDGVLSLETNFNAFLPGASNDARLKALKAIMDDIVADQ